MPVEFLSLSGPTSRWYNSHGVATLLFTLFLTRRWCHWRRWRGEKFYSRMVAQGQGGVSFSVDAVFTLIFHPLLLPFWIRSPMMKYCPPGSGSSSARASSLLLGNWIDFSTSCRGMLGTPTRSWTGPWPEAVDCWRAHLYGVNHRPAALADRKERRCVSQPLVCGNSICLLAKKKKEWGWTSYWRPWIAETWRRK